MQAARPGFFRPTRDTGLAGPAARGETRNPENGLESLQVVLPQGSNPPPVTFETATPLPPPEPRGKHRPGLRTDRARLRRHPHRARHRRQALAEAFEGALNEMATRGKLQRIGGALGGSAVGAGRFYSEKVSEARTAAARAADGGEERGAPIGLESKAQRTREFAADMAMQAFALLAAAKGAVDAYAELTGEDWKAYETRPEAQVEKKAAEAQMAAFGR